MHKFLQKGKMVKETKINAIFNDSQQTLVTYENIRVQRQHKSILTPHVIRNAMVSSSVDWSYYSQDIALLKH